MEGILELFDKFRDLQYIDETHTYLVGDTKLTSITQFLDKIKPKFNEDFWLIYKVLQAKGLKVSPVFTKEGEIDTTQLKIDKQKKLISTLYTKEVLTEIKNLKQEWKRLSHVGAYRGTFVHKTLENYERGLHEYPKIVLPQNMTTLQSIDYVNSIGLCKTLCTQYLNENRHLVPIAIEFRVVDLDLGLAGTFDRLYWNKQTGQFEIHDFKTDKKIEKKSKYGNFKIFDMPVCEDTKYCLQTSFYKFIIQKHTSLKLGTSRVIHFNLKEEKIDYYDCIDYCDQIKTTTENEYWTTHI